MNVTLHIGKDRVLTTAIVSKEDAKELVKEIRENGGNPESSNYQSPEATHLIPEEANPYEQYVPDLFRLPFGNVAPGDTISLKVEYIEPLDYYIK